MVEDGVEVEWRWWSVEVVVRRQRHFLASSFFMWHERRSQEED